jgi:broad specificity phosphatase PhoE
MVTVLLIRHATCDHVGRAIVGRLPGKSLNQRGRAQAESLAEALAGTPLGHAGQTGRPEVIYSSPLERAVETATILGRRLGASVRELTGLNELDFGTWTGRTLESLQDDPIWHAFNETRGATRIPGGESMAEGVDRAMAELLALEREHGGRIVAAVSHGDVIRGLLLRCLGMPLDHVHRLEVAPASVSVVHLQPNQTRVAVINWQAAGPLASE